ncbi:MAG: DNA polymerase domain-containing protein [Candidatus Bathyarchaeia archaeon]|jgi:DNA polymerase-2
MWLKKPGATPAEYEGLCRQIEFQLHFPIEFEGLYKWIVFLNSRTDSRIPVLNRYYGVFQNGKLKLRGIDFRKHDTPGIIRRCQSDMLTLLGKAESSEEFKALIPEALTVVKSYVSLVQNGVVPVEDLTIEKRLSKNPNEYRNMVPQSIAAQHLVREGMQAHAGQTLRYILSYDKSRITQNRALPTELMNEDSDFDSERYVNLLLTSATNLLRPFGYDPLVL